MDKGICPHHSFGRYILVFCFQNCSSDREKILKFEATHTVILEYYQRYTYRVLQTIQMKLILLFVWAEPAVLGSTKTALKLKYEI